MAGSSYIPSKLEDYESFARNLSTKLQADPTVYGMTIEGIAAFSGAYSVYAAAYATAQDPATRTKPAIAARNTAQRALTAQIRPLVATMQASPVMTDQKRDELRIPIRDYTPTVSPIPATSPKVIVRSVAGRLIELQLKEDGTERRGKPEGVRSAWLYSYVGEDQPTFEAMSFRGEVGRTYAQLVMPADVVTGSKVWVSACWVNPAGKPGAVSLPVFTWTNHGAMQNNAA